MAAVGSGISFFKSREKTILTSDSPFVLDSTAYHRYDALSADTISKLPGSGSGVPGMAIAAICNMICIKS